ncbi:TRM82 [Mytilus coruscus]|uniref:tRNA (guanine-N(7)-)-methyltransferase non-catalytic subunit n=1 Tax=Mytilus coruscus TaxID=42192 RepID=A0A6J8DPP0_MYTCO|nr:TRM82 [Mytilus coruscus]
MATLTSFTCGIICISGCNIISQTSRNEEIVQQKITLEDVKEKDQDTKDSGSDNNADKSVTSTKNHILASCCSDSGKYLALSDDIKQLYLYKFDAEWKIISRRPVPRRCTSLTFTQDEKYVLLADKTGDVYRFCIDDETHAGELLLGHLSMLLDIVVARNDEFVVTCDRDEKIRVSCYPNSYNVHSYCLKHTEYVASIIYIKDHDLLISGGGDGKVIIWSLNGEVLCEVECKTAEESFLTNSSTAEKTDSFPIKKCVYHNKLNLVCVCFYNSTQVHVYKLNVTDGVPGCDLCDVILVNKEPWDICFDSCQNLYVLQPVEGETIIVYNLTCQDNTVKAVKGKSDPWITALENLNKDWMFFQASEDIPSMYQGLKKQKIDQNMKDYMEKKQIRLSGQKIAQPPPKKVKQIE